MKNHHFKYYFGLFLFTIFSNFLSAQIDHWETAIFASDDWKYRLGSIPYPENWWEKDFDDELWAVSEGGFGYGDGDDGTTLPGGTLSVAMRKEFEVTDLEKFGALVLSADYDDGFVAYLNGVEIARNNMGQVGVPTPHDDGTPTDHEANLHQGEQPEYYTLYGVENYLTEGTNVLAIQVNNVGFWSSDMSANFFLSFGILDNSFEYENPPSWFEAPVQVDGFDLPILVINTLGQSIQNEPRIAAHLGIVDNPDGQLNYLSDSFNGYDGQISIEYRGASSQWLFPKKGMSFETQNADSTNNNVSLLGMPEENDWVLHGPYSDKSLLRNILTYEFARNMGRYAPRTRPIELIINGNYHGFYVLTERIKRDKNRVDIAKLTSEDLEGDELTGGYLLQIDRDDQWLPDGWYSNHEPFNFFAFDDPDWDEIQPAQWNYIQNYLNSFENAMQDNNYINVYQNLIDDDSFIDYILATEITKHIDAYRLSFFLYKDKDSEGGKLKLGPIWDINLGYGNYDYGCDNSPEGWSYDWGMWGANCAPITFWVPKIANIPDIQNKMKCRWDELREDVLATEILHNFIDSMVLVLDNAQDRNFDRWPVIGEYVWPNAFVGNSYQAEINHLKDWLEDRLDWMDSAIDGDCSLVNDSEIEISDFEVQVFPNPFENEVQFFMKNSNYQNEEIRIIDVLGRTILEKNITGNNLILETSNWERGVYFWEIVIDNQVVKKDVLIKS